MGRRQWRLRRHGKRDGEYNGFLRGGLYVQIAVFNSETGDVRFEDAAASQVKKSTGVAVYGETQENGEIRATKVYITRYQ